VKNVIGEHVFNHRVSVTNSEIWITTIEGRWFFYAHLSNEMLLVEDFTNSTGTPIFIMNSAGVNVLQGK
jgi:hypothetical protein